MDRGKVTIECGCGERVSTTDGDAKLECECGAVYAVTVTTLQAGGDVGARPLD